MRAHGGSRRTPLAQVLGNTNGSRNLALVAIAFFFIALSTSSQAAPGNGNGGGNGSDPPPVPIAITPAKLTPGWSGIVQVTGDAPNAEAYEQQQGNSGRLIEASFSGQGITVNSVTVTSTTTLDINVTVDAAAPLGAQSITVTNPDGQFSTSATPLATISDIPVILDAQVTPNPASVIDDLSAQVISIQNEDLLPVTYTYQWYENGLAISETNSVLSSQFTSCGSSYHCHITPIEGNLVGSAYSTAPVTILEDTDSNGLHDAWELDCFGSTGNDPNLDADGDGHSTRAEYLFGLDPTDPSSNRAIVKPLDPHTGTLEYRRAKNRISGITYRILTSSDLSIWTEEATYTETVVATDDYGETVRITLSAEILNNPRLYVRVSAE